MSPVSPIWKFAHSSAVNVPATIANATAVDFDGINKVYVVPDDNSLDLTTAFTKNVWVKGVAGSNDTFLAKRDTIASTLHWSDAMRKDETDGTRAELVVIADQAITAFKALRGVSSPNIFEASPSWHMITMRWDNSLGESDRLALFVDGVLETSGSRYTNNDNMSSVYSSPSATGIGATLNAGVAFLAFDGIVDEPIVWSSALSDAEVAAIFTAYTSGFAFNPAVNGGAYISAATAVSFWRMGDDPADDETIINDQISTNDGVGQNLVSGDLVSDTPP